jgi:hypothetical protein
MADDPHAPAGRTFQRPGAPANVMTDMQQRAQAARLRNEYVARKGEWVCCEAGHRVCRLAVDLRYGDMWGNHTFTEWVQPEPSPGTASSVVCAVRGCSATWWAMDKGLHFKGGWR